MTSPRVEDQRVPARMVGAYRRRDGRTTVLRRTLVGLLVGTATALAAPAAQARDITVTSFDGTRLVGSFFPAEGLGPGQQAPTVLSGHGWGGSHGTNPDAASASAGSIGVGALRRAGYNVLTWDARGFGASGGQVEVDGPETEGRDVGALLDFVSRQPEAALDEPGDPRAGMVGSSYGGGIQLVSAGIDRRLDAIVPDIAWHSLVTSLYKDGAFKSGWGDILYGAGVPTSLAPGLIAPSGLQAGTLDPAITQAFGEASATGQLSPASLNYFASRGPGDLVSRIGIPTFLTQGTPDTLFTLQEAITNYALLRQSGVPVKMLWHCGGHGVCLTDPGSEPRRIEREVLAWFARYLKGDPTSVTGPRFEWVSQDGVWHTAPDYPLPAASTPLTATGHGLLPIAPGPGTGSTIAAAPSPLGLDTPIPPPTEATDVVGAPSLTLTYSGTGGGPTHVYAQLVDRAANLVAGNQATPIPVTLDGRTHTITRDLEAVALHLQPGARYVLQLIPATTLYRAQTAIGALDVKTLRVTLPAVRIPGEESPTRRAPRVTLGLPGPVESKRGARTLAVRVRVTRQGLRGLNVTVTDARGRRLGLARRGAIAAGGARLIPVELSRPLTPGRYRVGATYRSASGGRGATSRAFVVR